MFFSVGSTGQLPFKVLNNDEAEYYLTIGALPLGVLVLVGAPRYKNRWPMMSFMVGCGCRTVYTLFTIYEGTNTTFPGRLSFVFIVAHVDVQLHCI
jgi:hypothetical protein